MDDNEHDRAVTRCQWCDAPTNDLDFCPACERRVRGGRRRGRPHHDMDLHDMITRRDARKWRDGWSMLRGRNDER